MSIRWEIKLFVQRYTTVSVNIELHFSNEQHPKRAQDLSEKHTTRSSLF